MALTVCKCNRGSLRMPVHTRANLYVCMCVRVCVCRFLYGSLCLCVRTSVPATTRYSRRLYDSSRPCTGYHGDSSAWTAFWKRNVCKRAAQNVILRLLLSRLLHFSLSPMSEWVKLQLEFFLKPNKCNLRLDLNVAIYLILAISKANSVTFIFDGFKTKIM